MVTLIKDIKAENTAEKEVTIREHVVTREKTISMFSLQQKSVNSRLKKLGEDMKSTANNEKASNDNKTTELPLAKSPMLRSKPHFQTSH